MLEIENLSISFPTRQGFITPVRNISFSLQEGETLGVVGESGSGKSLTSLSLMRLLPPQAKVTADKMTFLGKDLLNLPEKEMRNVRGGLVSMIFQDPMTALNPSFTVGFQLMEVLAAHRNLNQMERYEEAISLLNKVGIPDSAHRFKAFPHQLSGGMCQRVMIAISMACRPKLLIADEPTTALDVTIQAQILRLLKELQQEYHMGLILISHNIGLVAQNSERIQVMYAGEIVESGRVKDVLFHPRHPYTEGLLNSLPDHITPSLTPSPGRVRLTSIPGIVPDLNRRPSGCQFHPRCSYFQKKCQDEFPILEGGVRCFFPLKLKGETP